MDENPEQENPELHLEPLSEPEANPEFRPWERQSFKRDLPPPLPPADSGRGAIRLAVAVFVLLLAIGIIAYREMWPRRIPVTTPIAAPMEETVAMSAADPAGLGAEQPQTKREPEVVPVIPVADLPIEKPPSSPSDLFPAVEAEEVVKAKVDATEKTADKASRDKAQMIAALKTQRAQSATWTVTTPLSAARIWPTATLLSNGQVLVAGGASDSAVNASCDLYDPKTGNMTATGSLNIARNYQSATLLPNNKVLVVGGFTGPGSGGTALTSCELYDPTSGTWSSTGSTATPHSFFPITVSLPNGNILVAGCPGTSCELYNPATGVWSTTGSMSTARTCGRTWTGGVLLLNGTVLVAGGDTNNQLGTTSCEIYNPASGTWHTTGSMANPRCEHTTTLLNNGKVLAAGGAGGTPPMTNGISLSSCELYDPASGTWSATTPLANARNAYCASVLNNGQVLAEGGGGSGGASCELYDPVSGTWSTTALMNTGRAYHTSTLLSNGSVLVTGGSNGTALASCEVYNPGFLNGDHKVHKGK